MEILCYMTHNVLVKESILCANNTSCVIYLSRDSNIKENYHQNIMEKKDNSGKPF